MHGKNVGDIPTSGTSEKNGIVRMALFGQSYRRAARAINVGDTRNTRRTIPDRDVQNYVMDRERACSEIARWKKWRYNIKNKKNRESRVYRDMVIGVRHGDTLLLQKPKWRKGNLKYKQENTKCHDSRGSTEDPRKGKVESEGMKYADISGRRTLKKKNGRKESDEEDGVRGGWRDVFEKADTRRDAARKFYCRSLRGFHLQILRASPFLGYELRCGNGGEKRRRGAKRRGLPARNVWESMHIGRRSKTVGYIL